MSTQGGSRSASRSPSPTNRARRTRSSSSSRTLPPILTSRSVLSLSLSCLHPSCSHALVSLCLECGRPRPSSSPSASTSWTPPRPPSVPSPAARSARSACAWPLQVCVCSIASRVLARRARCQARNEGGCQGGEAGLPRFGGLVDAPAAPRQRQRPGRRRPRWRPRWRPRRVTGPRAAAMGGSTVARRAWRGGGDKAQRVRRSRCVSQRWGGTAGGICVERGRALRLTHTPREPSAERTARRRRRVQSSVRPIPWRAADAPRASKRGNCTRVVVRRTVCARGGVCVEMRERERQSHGLWLPVAA